VKKIYLGNIPFSATEQSIRNFLGSGVVINKISICTDKETGRPRGFAFVEVEDDNTVQELIRTLDGTDFEGRRAVVNKAVDKPRAPRQDSRPASSELPKEDHQDKPPKGSRHRRSSYREGDTAWENQKHK
jgi:RNA recognition motif-containing protein